MTSRFLSSLFLCAAFALAGIAAPRVHAHGEPSALSAASALSVASVVVGGSAVAGAALAVPAALSVSGATLVVRTVESTANGMLCVLERVSDGARVSMQFAGNSMAAGSLVAGSVVTTSVIGAGVVLSAAGEAIAFVPNALGRALLHDERLTQ